MKTCILADNQFITNQGIIALFRRMGIENIIQARTVNELQEKLKVYPQAIVVLDYTLFDFTSMEQMLNFKSAVRESQWILFSSELGEHFTRYVLFSDPAISVIMKNDPEEEIRAALENAIYNIPYICEYAEHILHNTQSQNPKIQPVKLTPMEKIILHEIAIGKTTKEIAYEKNLSFHTINSHRKNIFRKLEINNVHEAVKYAIRAGILHITEYYI